MNLKNLTFSPPQLDVLRHSVNEKTSMFAGGAVRSGKSFSVMISFAIWLIGQKDKYDHILSGLTIESAMRNVGYDLIDYLNSIEGVTASYTSYVGSKILVSVGSVQQVIWLCGAGDIKARKRIQGATFKGVVLDELTIMPKDFFYYVWSRMSVSGAKMWCSFNPENPGHYVLREVLQNKEK